MNTFLDPWEGVPGNVVKLSPMPGILEDAVEQVWAAVSCGQCTRWLYCTLRFCDICFVSDSVSDAAQDPAPETESDRSSMATLDLRAAGCPRRDYLIPHVAVLCATLLVFTTQSSNRVREKTYVLSDVNIITVGAERFHYSEELFQPSFPSKKPADPRHFFQAS